MTIFTLLGEILIKDNGAKKTLEDVNSAGEKTSSGLTGAFGKIGSAALKVGAMVGIGFGFKEAIGQSYKLAESASDLNEAQNVVEQTFGKSAKSIETWTTTTEKSAGISQTASMQWSGFMGAMLKSSGVSESASASMSKNLVQLTGDMSSFYNVSTSDMWEKIRSGISGETEPLKEIGINMSVANLQAYALAEGIKKPYAQMSQGEQTQLRYNYLMSVTKDAQGDFGRTLGTSFANQMRVAQMNLADLGRSVGTMLLPAFMSASSWFNSHMPEIKNAIANMISGAGSVIKTLAPIVSAGFGSFKGIMDWIVQHSELTKAAIIGIGTAFATLKTISTINKAMTDFRNGMNLISGATGIVSRLGTAFMELRTAPTILTGIKGAFTAIFAVNPMILAIVAGIALLAAGAYLIVTHWTQVKTFFTNLWTGVKQKFNEFWNWLKPFMAQWGPVILTVIAPFIGIPLLIAQHWEQIKTFFSNLWSNITITAIAGWNSFWSAVGNILNSIGNGIKNIWNGLLSWFGSLPSRLYSLGSSMFNSMKSGISNVLGTITSVVRSGFNGAISFITSLPSKAIGWGKDFINGLINGIKSMIGGVANAVSGVADKIRSFLHFSVPDEGPLSDADTYGSDFMDLIAGGIADNKFKVVDSIKSLAGDMKVNATANITANANGSKSNNNIDSSQANTPKQPIVIQLVLQNMRVIAEAVLDDLDELKNQKFVLTTRRQGGVL
ncbi:phage tail protein [Clostridium guangxiense]|uniref:phage tail protein n=1 Tax=Clostridium guangxiense TaxID=1662055 RepID=UPI001E517CB7|nr:hypothetical protein [Clostridium guangxiense]MCD2345821.1 hypothetical protein [Clostridium guangxiense]